MLYLYYGHSAAAKHKAAALAESLLAKQPDAAFVHLAAGAFTGADIEERLGGQGLFFSKSIVRIDGALSDKDKTSADILVPLLDVLAASQNIFILAEGALPAAHFKEAEKHANKMQECKDDAPRPNGQVGSAPALSKQPEFNTFAVADALAVRNVPRTILLLNDAWEAGAEPEQVHGIMVWQVKAMLAAHKGGSATAAGLSPFVFSKAKAGASAYGSDTIRLEHMLFSLVGLAHQEWGEGLMRGLERWVLERVG